MTQPGFETMTDKQAGLDELIKQMEQGQDQAAPQAQATEEAAPTLLDPKNDEFIKTLSEICTEASVGLAAFINSKRRMTTLPATEKQAEILRSGWQSLLAKKMPEAIAQHSDYFLIGAGFVWVLVGNAKAIPQAEKPQDPPKAQTVQQPPTPTEHTVEVKTP